MDNPPSTTRGSGVYGEPIAETVARRSVLGRTSPPVDSAPPPPMLALGERWYFPAAIALVLLSALLWAVFGLGAASPVLLLLAIVLLAGWLVL